jgi:hypothetical protein
MKFRYTFYFFLFLQLDLAAQTDNLWNLLILKKGNQPVIRDNMAEYSPTGFYMYKNCFYDLQFRDKSKKTLRLIDIKQDTLIFIGISPKRDTDLSIVSKDTFWVHYKNIAKMLLLKDIGSNANKKLNCDDYHFIFHQSTVENRHESKSAHIYSHTNGEIIPRLSASGISYYSEFGGRLFYNSGIQVNATYYSDDQKIKVLNGVLTALDILVNKRVNVIIIDSKKD